MKRLTIRMADDEYKKLVTLAKKNEVSVNAAVIGLLHQQSIYLARENQMRAMVFESVKTALTDQPQAQPQQVQPSLTPEEFRQEFRLISGAILETFIPVIQALNSITETRGMMGGLGQQLRRRADALKEGRLPE
jgi:hypothetical protein